MAAAEAMTDQPDDRRSATSFFAVGSYRGNSRQQKQKKPSSSASGVDQHSLPTPQQDNRKPKGSAPAQRAQVPHAGSFGEEWPQQQPVPVPERYNRNRKAGAEVHRDKQRQPVDLTALKMLSKTEWRGRPTGRSRSRERIPATSGLPLPHEDAATAMTTRRATQITNSALNCC